MGGIPPVKYLVESHEARWDGLSLSRTTADDSPRGSGLPELYAVMTLTNPVSGP